MKMLITLSEETEQQQCTKKKTLAGLIFGVLPSKVLVFPALYLEMIISKDANETGDARVESNLVCHRGL